MATIEQTTFSKVLHYNLDPFVSGVVAALVGMVIFLLLQANAREVLLTLGCGVFCFAVGYFSRRYGRQSREGRLAK